MNKNSRDGISLIVLVISIVITFILAGAIVLLITNNNPINQASKLAFMSDIERFKGELDAYNSREKITKQHGYSSSKLQANDTSVTYNGIADNNKTIVNIITSLEDMPQYYGLFEIVDGKLVFTGTEPNQQEWASEIGVGMQETTVAGPLLATGMTAKKWNGSDWVTVLNPDTDTTWYNYDNKEWANAQTADGSMWVWIPRYEYKITNPHTSTEQTILVNLLKDTSSSATSGYTIHPAFTFGTVELTGIWVAKFEAGGSKDAVEIKPGITSLNLLFIGEMFEACRDMETYDGAKYGWGTSGSGIDTHLMKNTEWGAVAYFSSSAYGKTGEVWINPNSELLTGHAGTSASESRTASTYAYDDLTYGVNASTTGNVYGIYDMNGGLAEQVAAYLDNGSQSLTYYGPNLLSAESKYKDVYTPAGGDTEYENYAAASERKGDAVYETSILNSGIRSWYNIYSHMPYSDLVLFTRGGSNYMYPTRVGMFYINSHDGCGDGGAGFRPVLAVDEALNDIDTIPPLNPEMVASPSGWTNGNVTVTITFSADSTTKQYSTNGTTWNTYTTPVTISTNNTTVYAKAIDAAGNQTVQATLTIANIDKDAPTIEYGTNGGSAETASTTVTVSDTGGSNLNTSILQYVWDTQNISTPSDGWTTFTNAATITNINTTGTYYLWIKAADNAGNITVSKTNLFTIVELQLANKPVLTAGMTAKKWNGSSWVTVASPDTDTTWYNYNNKEWANAQTADGSMWVWIPRYEYQIPTPHTNEAQTISVNFLSNLSTTATSGYTVHPAFTFGSTELTGIWVAKFEASGTTNAIDIKPSAASLTNITIGTMFQACRNMETINGVKYGWGTSGTGIDTHLMKNSEWGAVAYLSSSTYGKTGEIWKNPNTLYLTGQAGTSVNASSTGTTYAYDNLTYGVNASTTGNIYGVYDMSGCTWEYTAAYVNNGSSSLTTYGSSLQSALAQYKDIYISSGDTGSGNYTANSSKKGDAVYETSNDYIGNVAWYGDSIYMPCSTDQFFVRGDEEYSTGTNAGIFGFSGTDGNINWVIGFRPVLAVSGTL